MLVFREENYLAACEELDFFDFHSFDPQDLIVVGTIDVGSTAASES